MKVIDLMNKIANGEEVPEKIRIGSDEELRWNGNYYAMENEEEYYTDDAFITPYYNLNCEIEIIEENKLEKIPEVEIATSMAIGEKICARKINEIIDYIKNKENE